MVAEYKAEQASLDNFMWNVLIGKATESIASIRTVRSFGGEQMEVDQYKQALEEASHDL